MRTVVIALAAAAFVACGDQGDPATPPPVANAPVASPYPSGPYGLNQGDVLADVTLNGVDAYGHAASIALHDVHAANQVLVLRVTAGFCGTCRWHGEHFTPPANVRLVDVLVRNDDAEDPTTEDLTAWHAHQRAPGLVVLDAASSFVLPRHSLPRYLVVDPATMKVRASLDDPPLETLNDAIAAAPTPTAVPLTDGRFDAEQADMIRDMTLVGDAPLDPSNRYSGDNTVAFFGKKLFNDALLSPSGGTSCARCHEEERDFTDGAETATGGVGGNDRNTPNIMFSAWARWQMWDGRADSLWMQALLPIEATNEFGSSRLFVAHRVYDAYKVSYEANFGPLPPLDDLDRFPSDGKPGDPAYDKMSGFDRDAVTFVFVNVGKSIAAFERNLRPVSIFQFDHLSDSQKDGLLAFFQAGCAQCHYGNRLTDDAFHALRFPTGRQDLQPDVGRQAGIPQLLASEFLKSGRWSDARTPEHAPTTAHMLSAFKTPSLRGVGVTGPYGHGGSVPTLNGALDLHRTQGEPAGNRYTTGDAEPWLPDFTPAQETAITSFLSTLGI